MVDDDDLPPLPVMLENLLADFLNPFPSLPWETALMRMVTAALVGGAIGWERQASDKPAGTRTHMLIAVAACLFTLLSLELVELSPEVKDRIFVDPLRLIEAVTAGVAFLAAGSVITSGGSVRGLTTGAAMWMAGAIGVACGTGDVLLALMAGVVALLILHILHLFTRG